MKWLGVMLLALVLVAGASAVKEYNADFNLVDDKAVVDIMIMFDNATTDALEFVLPEDYTALSVYVDLYGTGEVDEAVLERALREVMDLSPSGIRRTLDLNKPIYARTAAYGHFGREPDADGGFSWEKTDLVDALGAAV